MPPISSANATVVSAKNKIVLFKNLQEGIKRGLKPGEPLNYRNLRVKDKEMSLNGIKLKNWQGKQRKSFSARHREWNGDAGPENRSFFPIHS
jgi:hypothetical protein